MRTAARRALERAMTSTQTPRTKLEDLSKEDLIARIYALEAQLPPQPSQRRPQELYPFPFDKHPKRKIALKFCYAGWEYNGLAAQSQPTPLPTVEQVLFDALVNTRLVDPVGGMEGCGWSRCGRTDRGVSAAGQVVSLVLRSALGEKPVRPKNEAVLEPLGGSMFTEGNDESTLPLDIASSGSSRASSPKLAESPKRELAYIHMINRVLPPTIRVLAWSPVADTFDARFSCQYRHYKYFFARGGKIGQGGLDIAAMRDAAWRLVGEHDFRNFCKLDPSKQIENFSRRVLGAWIERVDQDKSGSSPVFQSKQDGGSDEDIFVFNLKGTAFLWHQVRCIMAVLFLVGSRLESPSVIDALLHTSSTSSKGRLFSDLDSTVAFASNVPVESKPNYTMADALPLVLWDCGYNPDDVQWQTDSDVESKDGVVFDRERTHNFWYQLYSIWARDRIQATMQSYFLRAAEAFYPSPASSQGMALGTPRTPADGLVRINTGGGAFRHTTRYIPILELERGERAEAANQRWKEGAVGKRKTAKRGVKAEGLDV
ncbi:hypothetical protein CTheo_6233 [Ceratobasidium theobromae]|uniref:Pseudouridine synthase I TruA alpha/beta domain-containing protein n=1 Tax=Ceratobasidium theobromae TaxID=1582974 RepID=A0A5N5QFR4_9AGAM|nr:hypothetical protein CTheo_6233 [Ceratobasidium theobromae]